MPALESMGACVKAHTEHSASIRSVAPLAHAFQGTAARHPAPDRSGPSRSRSARRISRHPDGPISDADYKRLIEKYGRERLGKASEELVEIDTEKKLATLKAEVRRLCQAILGPAPEDWDSFYEGITNPPPNPYTAEPAPAKRKPENLGGPNRRLTSWPMPSRTRSGKKRE